MKNSASINTWKACEPQLLRPSIARSFQVGWIPKVSYIWDYSIWTTKRISKDVCCITSVTCTPRKFSSCPRKEESNTPAKMKQVKLSRTNFLGSYKTTAPWSQMEMHQFSLTALGTASAFLLLLPVPAHKMLHLTSIWLHLSKITQFFSILGFYCKHLIHHISWVRLYSLYLFLGFSFSFYVDALSPQSLTGLDPTLPFQERLPTDFSRFWINLQLSRL